LGKNKEKKNEFDLPFQNRHTNLLKIAKQLIANSKSAHKQQKRNLSLISFTQCMGTGKTRITKDFLKIILSKKYNHLLNEDKKQFFEKSILFYISFADFHNSRMFCQNFTHSFYYHILGEICSQMKIRKNDGKLLKFTEFLPNAGLKSFLEQLLIDQEEQDVLKIIQDYSESQANELDRDIQKIRDYVKQNVQGSCVKFIILAFDEIQVLNELSLFSPTEITQILDNLKGSKESLKTEITCFYHIWNNFLFGLHTDVTGLLVAGRDSYIPFLGRHENNQLVNHGSPTGLFHINLNCLSKTDIQNIFDELRENKSFKFFDDFFRQKEKKDYDDLIENIHFYSGGLGGIVSIIAENIQQLEEQDLSNCFSSKNEMKNYFEKIGKTPEIKNMNPFIHFKENLNELYESFLFLGQAEKQIEKNRLACDFLPLPENIPITFTIEDTLLKFGIPYSMVDENNLMIILPQYFKQAFENELEQNRHNTYSYILFFLHETRKNLDKSRVFEFLISLSFYEMLNINFKETIQFIETDIDVIQSKTIQTYERISTDHNGMITTDINEYFDGMHINSINVPADQSYGADCWIKLKRLLKYIIIGLQMKCYFSKKTELTKGMLDIEIAKIVRIMEKLSKTNKDIYGEFYYVIVCPSFGSDLSQELFPKQTKKKISRKEKEIVEDDYVEYCPQTFKNLRIIILTEECVERLTGKDFVDSQKEYDLTEFLRKCTEALKH